VIKEKPCFSGFFRLLTKPWMKQPLRRINVNPEREHAFQPALPVKGEQNVWDRKQKSPASQDFSVSLYNENPQFDWGFRKA
jgi:hypothetical protein